MNLSHKITISLNKTDVENVLKEYLKIKYPQLEFKFAEFKLESSDYYDRGLDIQTFTGADITMYPAKESDLISHQPIDKAVPTMLFGLP